MASAGAGAGTLALVRTLALAGALALAGIGAWPGALALAGAGAWIGAWIGLEMDKWIVPGDWWLGGGILGGCLAGSIAGYSTGIGIWAGLGMGILTLVQSPIIFGAMITAEETLNQDNHPFRIFLILSMFSLLGLALGGGFGWLIKLSGVRLPT